jgi:4-amino-4-deoxy-L-arabinose transferase-like glycosyltransferase
LLLTLLFIVKATQTGRTSTFLLAGVLLGVTNLCRGTLIYFPGFLFLLLIFYRDGLWLRRLSGVIALTAAMALTMLPWTVRNYKHFHDVVPVAIGSGDVLWTGTYLPFDGEFRYEETEKKIDQLVNVDMTLIERDRILMAEAKKNIAEQPLRSAWLFVRKMFRYWFRVYENVPKGESRETNWLILGALGATHFVLLALAIAGLWPTRLGTPIIGAALLLFFYYTSVHAATLAVPRYRQPLVPLLCIFAAAGLRVILGKSHSKHVISRERNKKNAVPALG